MILQNSGMVFSASCSMTHIHRRQGSFLSFSKSCSSQVVRNLDVAGHTLKWHTFSVLNVTWMSLNMIRSMYLSPAFIHLYHLLLGYLWNELCLVNSALTHMTSHISAIMRRQDTMRTRMSNLMRSKVFLVGF